MGELKKCPFSGGEARLKMENRHDVGWVIYVECKVCNASTLGYCPNLSKEDTALEDINNCKKLAIEAWNRRAEE